MGASLSLDVDPSNIDDVLSYKPAGSPKSSPYRSNLKIWRFFATNSPLEVLSKAVAPGAFAGFSEHECYVLLHIYRRSDGDGDTRPSNRSRPTGSGTSLPAGAVASAREGSSTTALAQEMEQLFTPRGLSGAFSGYDDCGPYPFERNSEGGTVGEPLAHDIYIWNGRAALALTKAIALTKCFELERLFINDEVGIVAHLHSGQHGELQSAASLYAADYTPQRMATPEANHLLSLLCHHVDADRISCRQVAPIRGWGGVELGWVEDGMRWTRAGRDGIGGRVSGVRWDGTGRCREGWAGAWPAVSWREAERGRVLGERSGMPRL